MKGDASNAVKKATLPTNVQAPPVGQVGDQCLTQDRLGEVEATLVQDRDHDD